jgi:hypothetical protein
MLKSFSRPVLPAPYVRQLGVRFRGNGAPCRIRDFCIRRLIRFGRQVCLLSLTCLSADEPAPPQLALKR